MAPNQVYQVIDARTYNNKKEYLILWVNTWEPKAEINTHFHRVKHILNKQGNSDGSNMYLIHWFPSWVPAERPNIKQAITEYYKRMVHTKKTELDTSQHQIPASRRDLPAPTASTSFTGTSNNNQADSASPSAPARVFDIVRIKNNNYYKVKIGNYTNTILSDKARQKYSSEIIDFHEQNWLNTF